MGGEKVINDQNLHILFLITLNIVIRYETLLNLALTIGCLQYKWIWSIAWQVGKESNKYGGHNEIVSAQNGVTGQFDRLYLNTRTKKRFFKNQIHETDSAWKLTHYRVNHAGLIKFLMWFYRTET